MNGRALVVLAHDRRNVRGAEHAVLEHGVVTFTVNGITTSFRCRRSPRSGGSPARLQIRRRLRHTRPTVVRTAVVRTASTVTPKQVRWLWEPRIPLGKLTILAGAAGQGKSQTTTMLAALTSKGAAAGDLLHTCGDVLMVSAEDDFEDTVVPRLIAAGAQLERVHGLDMQEEIDGIKYPSSVSLPGDAARIHQLARDLQVKLVALDPVSGLLDEDHSAISNQQVRRALAPIKAMAEDVGCAVVAVMHTNKANGTNALARIADSGAFTAFARSVMFMARPVGPRRERGSRRSSRCRRAILLLRASTRSRCGSSPPSWTAETASRSRRRWLSSRACLTWRPATCCRPTTTGRRSARPGRSFVAS